MSKNLQPASSSWCRTIAASGLDHHLAGVRVSTDPDPAAGLATDPGLGWDKGQRDRARTAITACSWAWPDGPVVLERDQEAGDLGSSADLAIAVAVLTASGQAVTWPELDRILILGELGPDGSIRACRGVYPAVKAAAAAGVSRVIVPAENAAEARLVPGVVVTIAGSSLVWVNSWLATATASTGDATPVSAGPGSLGPWLVSADPATGEVTAEPARLAPVLDPPPWDGGDEIEVGPISVAPADLAEIPGHVLRAVGVAAAGGHHMLLTHDGGAGFPGDVAALLVRLLPPLDRDVREQVMGLWSLAGLLDTGTPTAIGEADMVTAIPDLVLWKLYGQPGQPAQPGYMSLAHHGVLHIYDTAAFRTHALDVVAQTMTRGSVVAMSRSPFARYPAAFQLVATTPACPKSHTPCTCRPEARDLHTRHVHDTIGAHTAINITATGPAETFTPDLVPTVDQVATARIRAAARWRARGNAFYTNHTVPAEVLRSVSDDAFAPGVHDHLAQLAADKILTGAHGEHVMRLMWTLADLDGVTSPSDEQLTQALALHLPGYELR